MADLDIHWPDQYHPDNCAVHVVNQLGLDVSAEAAWNCLIRATGWPNWYPNSANVRLLGTEKTCLLYTSPSPRDRTRSRMPSSS